MGTPQSYDTQGSLGKSSKLGGNSQKFSGQIEERE